MSQVVIVLLVSTIAATAGILVTTIVWGVMCQRRASTEEFCIPRRREMQRYMLMGLYCNSEDPRPFVPRPNGWGWTLNVRKEEVALLLWTLLLTMMIAGLMLATAPGAAPV